MNQESFSWADRNNSVGSHLDFVTPRTGDSQGFCGSCWAFSITQAAEIAYRIHFFDQGFDTTGVMVNFSEEALISARISYNEDEFVYFSRESETCNGIDRDIYLNYATAVPYPIIPEWKSPYLHSNHRPNEVISIDYGYDTPYIVEYSMGGVDYEYDIWNDNNVLFQGPPKKGYFDLWKRLNSSDEVKEAMSCGTQKDQDFIPRGPILTSVLMEKVQVTENTRDYFYTKEEYENRFVGHGVVLVGWIDKTPLNEDELCTLISLNDQLYSDIKDQLCENPEQYNGVFLILDNHVGNKILYTPDIFLRFDELNIVTAAVKFDFSSYYTPDDDFDSDSVPDVSDNCPYAYNPGQKDTDGDGTGDPCDKDIDGDMIENSLDLDFRNPKVAFDLNTNNKYEKMELKDLKGIQYYKISDFDCGDAEFFCNNLYPSSIIEKDNCVDKCNNSDDYSQDAPSPGEYDACKNRNYLHPGCLAAIESSSDTTLMALLNTLDPCELVANSMRYDFYDYWTDVYATEGWWTDSYEFYSWLNDRRYKCEQFFNPFTYYKIESDIDMISMENSGVRTRIKLDQYTTVGTYTTGDRFELQFKDIFALRTPNPEAGSWYWEHQSSSHKNIGGCVCNGEDYQYGLCNETCSQTNETYDDGEIDNKIWDPVYNPDVCTDFNDSGANPYPEFCINITIPSSDYYRSVDFMRDEFYDYDKAIFDNANPVNPAYRHINDYSEGEFTARMSKERCPVQVEKTSGECELNEMEVTEVKYSNTINLLTSVETILYGGEIHLWIPKKLNIFRGYVDKPDIWSFFLGEDDRDFLVQQTATSPEINNMAMITNSDIIGGSFYEESSEGSFFINCRKHGGEIKFTLDKVSDYTLEIVNVMQVSGDIPNFETVTLLPVDKKLIIVTGLDIDGNLYVGNLHHSKDYADLEIKGYVPGVDSFSSVMLVDRRVIVVGNNDNGNSIWYEYYDSKLRKIYESYERISSMTPYKSSILAIADNDRVLYLESLDKMIFNQLPMDGLPENSDLSGWKLLKSDYPTIMSLESSEKDAFFAYKLNETDRWERIECLNTL